MEEAVQMETKLCDNCKKDVPVNNYLNHSIHCPRNIRLCPRCNEPYPIIEMESHIDQDHAEVVCPDCYEFMEAADLPSHKTDACPKRLVSCIICEVDLPATELNEHLDYCGSRSDRCDGCGKLVLMKHQPFHLSTRHALVKPETEAQQAQCMEQFLNQYKKVTSAGVEPDNNRSTNSNTNKATATTSSRSTLNTSNGIHTGSQSSSISNGVNTGSQLHQTAKDASSNSRSTANLISSTSSSASNAASTSLVSPLKSSLSPSYLPPQPSAASPSSSYLSSLPAPSPSVVALLEPVFNAPTSAPTSTSSNNPIRPNTVAPSIFSSAPSNNPIRPTTHIAAPSKVSPAPSSNGRAEDFSTDSSPSVATLRNVDNAIRECVDSISAGLRVGAGGSSDGSISSSLNALRSQSSGNNKVDSARSSRDGTGLSINRILSNINSNEMTPVPSAHSQSCSNRSSSSLASSTSKQSSNSTATASGPAARPYTANERHYEEEGAASLESQFNSRPQTGPKFEVLRPTSGSEPSDRMKPVNRPPLQTRRRNYQDDVLTEYMHLLEEQGLSNGLHTSSSSQNKPTRSTTTTSRPNSNLLGATNPYNAGAGAGIPDQNDVYNLFNGVGARGLRDNNARQHIAPRETVRERADRMRRDRDREELTALTRATELRGLNQVLTQGRNIVNQALDEEAALCLPCEFCDAPIPMDHLILHQTGCRPDLIYH
uniref:TRAF-type zinc finger domain-containing protein 1 n=1 Tax=Cacopsylla melanoneura TaxID=428564 RepID=A0A8D8M607_9HEMI